MKVGANMMSSSALKRLGLRQVLGVKLMVNYGSYTYIKTHISLSLTMLELLKLEAANVLILIIEVFVQDHHATIFIPA